MVADWAVRQLGEIVLRLIGRKRGEKDVPSPKRKLKAAGIKRKSEDWAEKADIETKRPKKR